MAEEEALLGSDADMIEGGSSGFDSEEHDEGGKESLCVEGCGADMMEGGSGSPGFDSEEH